MTNELFHEQLDAYLTHRLPVADKVAFEQALATDPLLANEVALQKEIVGALANQRKLALKQRLQKIDTSSIPAESSSIWTFAGIGATVGVVALAGIIFVNSGGDGTEKANVSENIATQTIASSSETSSTKPVDNTNIAATENQGDHPTTSAKADVKNAGTSANQTKHEIATPNFGDAGSESNGSLHNADAEHENTGSKVSGAPADGLVEDIEIVKDNSKYTNHYRYVNNKLYLYGDFDKNLYELIELNVSKGKKLYIYNQGQFAQVMPGTSEITKFIPITEQNLVLELNALKKKKSD